MTIYDSDYEVRLAELGILGGDTTKQYDSVYEIDLEILRLTEQGSGADIQTVDVLPDAETNKDKIVRLSTDNQIYLVVDNSGTWEWEALVVTETQVINDNVTSTETTWSSSKIDEELQSVAGTANSEFDGKTTEDFTFVTELPVSGEEGQQVIIKGENVDTLYKYVSDAWVEQTPDANILYFDTVNEALYSYITAEHQFAPISIVNTIVVGKNLNSNAALKNVKEPGVYNVLQRTSSTTKGEYTKKWTLTVEGVDYDEYELTDSVYQKLQSNYTIQKRTWSSSRQTNDGWSSFSTYYAGEIKDTTTSKYYTWSSKKINDTRGYAYDGTDGSFATKYRQDEEDGGQELVNTATGYGAVAEGYMTTASGSYGSHAEGLRTQATGECAHAEGYETQATGNFGSHAEGYQTLASNQMGHAEGYGTKATGDYGAHAEGYLSEANEQVSHAEGRSIVNGRYGHGEGFKTEVKNYAEHAQGRQNVSHTDGESEPTYNNPKRTIHSIGIGTRDSNHLNAVEVMTNGDYYLRGIGGYDGVHIKYETGYENTKTLQEVITDINTSVAGKQDTLTTGTNIDITNNTISAKGYTYDDTVGSIKQHNIAYGDDSTTEDNNVATGTNCAVFGQGNTASSKCTLVAGESNTASNSYAVVAGYGNTVSKMAGVAFGRENTVAGQCGFAEGYNNNVTGQNAHAEGRGNTVSGQNSHAEGWFTTATGKATHSEGLYTDATGDYSHAEGWGSDTLHNLASGEGSHAEGIMTMASGKASHAEGYGSQEAPNTASALGSHVEGVTTFAQNFGEHAEGRSNISHKASDIEGNAGNTQHSVGVGNGSTRTNAFEIMQNADMYIKGVGGYDGVHIKGQDSGITVSTVQEVIAGKQDALNPNTNISIDASNNISALGYVYDATKQSVAEGTSKALGTTSHSEGTYREETLPVTFSGAANATVLQASGSLSSIARNVLCLGCIVTIDGSAYTRVIGIDTSNNTITLYKKLSSEALSGATLKSVWGIAYGTNAHSEGNFTAAFGNNSHTEGEHTVAALPYCHAEGVRAIAFGRISHAEGYNSTAIGEKSHVEGVWTVANNNYEHASGVANISHKASDNYQDSGNTLFSIGNGTTMGTNDAAISTQSNAFEVMQNGDIYVKGIGGYQGTNTKVQDNTIKTLQEYIATLEARIAALENPNA